MSVGEKGTKRLVKIKINVGDNDDDTFDASAGERLIISVVDCLSAPPMYTLPTWVSARLSFSSEFITST